LQATQNSEIRPSSQVSEAVMTSVPDEKWRTFNCIFSVGSG